MTESVDREEIIATLKSEALNGADTGWLSDLARRGLAWGELDENIIVGDWYGSVDVGHLAEIVARLIEKSAKDLLSRLEQAEQAVQRVREALSEVQTRGEKIRAKGNNGSIYQQERAARGEGYLEATRLAFRALDGDGRG